MFKNLLAIMVIAFAATTVQAQPVTVKAESETVVLLSVSPKMAEDYIRMNSGPVLNAMGMKIISREKDVVKVQINTLRHFWSFSLKESEDKDKGEFKAVMTEAHKGGIVDIENKITIVADKSGSRVTIGTKATVSERGVTAKELQRELILSQKGLSKHLQAKLKK